MADSQPNMENHPAYIIYRDVPPGDLFDATTPLSFFPPKGSDELFDALRLAFPLLKTHSERMRDAIIQFLLEERREEQFTLSSATTLESSQTTWPSVSTGSASASAFSSPDQPNFATPDSFTPLTRHASTATSSQPSPPCLDQMTGVFSLSANPQPKQRVRRKMTEAEKVEYRKRRIVKACDKCAKRKRKCPHNQAEMKNIPMPSTKSSSPQSALLATPASRQADQYSPATFGESFDPAAFEGSFDPTAFGSFGDFNMFDDPLPEVSVDDFFHFEHFPDSNALVNNHEPFVPHASPTHQVQQYNEPGLKPISSHGETQRQSRLPSSELAPPVVSPGAHVQVQADPQTQMIPSHRAVRDPRTDVSFSQSRLPSQMAEGHKSDSLGHVNRLDVSDTALRSPDHVPGGQPQLVSSNCQEFALTSTSVSTLSGSSRSAALQGRPQPFGLANTENISMLPGQTPDNSELRRRQLSLGESMNRADSLATELFRLRRRLPTNRRMETGGSRTSVSIFTANTTPDNGGSRGQQCPEQLSAQANGGACVGSGNLRNTHNSQWIRKAAPLSSNQSAASEGVTFQQQDGRQNILCQQDVRQGVLHPQDVYQDRLSDHVRYRDHHGRPQTAGLLQVALALGAVLLLAMLSPSSSSISVLGLALLSTATTGASGGVVQCTESSTSWLLSSSRWPSMIKSRALKSQRFVRGSSARVAEVGPCSWFPVLR